MFLSLCSPQQVFSQGSRVKAKTTLRSLLCKACIYISFMQVSFYFAWRAPDGEVTTRGCQNTLLQLCQAGNSQAEAA